MNKNKSCWVRLQPPQQVIGVPTVINLPMAIGRKDNYHEFNQSDNIPISRYL